MSGTGLLVRGPNKVRGGRAIEDDSSIIISKTYIGGENIGGQRVVVSDTNGEVITGDQATPSHCAAFTGITLTSVATGEKVEVISYGNLVDPSFSFTPMQPIYFGAAGAITQTPPTSGFSQVIGHAVDTDEIFINPQIPTELT